MSELKSNEKAVACRADGNKLYSDRCFHKALLKYNESLCFAEVGSENVGHAFANRSAVYLEMKLFERCRANIELAKQFNYPETSLETLNKRDEKCRVLMKSETKACEKLFVLSHPANKKFPFVVDCLEVREDEKYGRYVVTNKSLRVGDIIAIEKPFVSVLLSESNFADIPKSNIFQRCTNCLADNALDLIPCSFCCRAMFCSTKCLEVALNRYHRYECSVMNRLIKSGSVHMSLRMFFVAMSTFDGSVEKLENFLKENEKKSLTIFDVDEKTSSKDKEKIRLLALLSFAKSSNSFSLVQHEEILKSHCDLSEAWETHQDFIKNFIQRVSQIADHSFHGIFSGSTEQDEISDSKTTLISNLQQPIGNGSMLFCALINHSCSSNVFRVYLEGKVVVIVCRPIQKGSQIFDCYNTSFIKQPKADRQSRLLRDFGFICDCEACSQDFPTPPALTCRDMKLLKFAKKTDDEMLKLQLSQARKKFRVCCELLEKNYQNFPSVELYMLQKCVASFFLVQARPIVLFP